MIKKSYLKELEAIGFIQKGDKGPKVERIQEWINLNMFFRPDFKVKCSIDEDFGPQTKKAVSAFQILYNLEVDGVVGPETWGKLTEPMRMAYDNEKIIEYLNGISKNYSPREAIMACAKFHLKAVPRELLNKNEGPWVRAYMGGHDGQPWAWCVGSTLQMIDQGLSICGIDFTDYLPNTYSCDSLGKHAKKHKTLIRNKELREMSLSDLMARIHPGDILNVSKTPTDWTHTALITRIHADHLETWEGNTNDEGSREGFEVCRRKRYFLRQNVDVILLNLKTD